MNPREFRTGPIAVQDDDIKKAVADIKQAVDELEALFQRAAEGVSDGKEEKRILDTLKRSHATLRGDGQDKPG